MPVSVVTGATGGIGKWIALGLAQAGHIVVMIGRDRERGDAALAWITARVPTARVELLVADLSSLAATRHAAMLIDARYPMIDILVNNAGIFATKRQETEEGHERVIALNHLSPFILTRALIPALRSATVGGHEARIINVGSSMSDRARINPADLEGKRRWGMTRSYSQSKLALMMVTFGWARRLTGTGVTANVVHPGAVATKLIGPTGVAGLAWRVMSPFLLSEEQGADTPLHAALSPDLRTVTGAYIKKRQLARPNRRTLDEALVERVWLATETLADG